MAIKVSQAFQRTSANPIDESMALTKAQMLAVNDNLMPAYYFTICQDDGEVYLYDKTATPDEETGKFKKFAGGGGAQADWNQVDDEAPDYIKNKPAIGSAAAKNSTNAVTEGSTNLVESGAVYNYIATEILGILNTPF